MTPESGQFEKFDDDRSISEIGRELLKYLHRRIEDIGLNQASYRQARMELLTLLESSSDRKRFNWGFEAVFTQEIHILEELGLLAVKYGSGAIMAGRSNPNQIYNLSLTDDGKDTAGVIVQREDRTRSDTARVEDAESPMELADDDEEELDETDRSEDRPSTTSVEPTPAPDDALRPSPGSEYAHDEDKNTEK